MVGGGYKYLQFGEGNAYMRLPAHADRIRPVVTGWFAEFAEPDRRRAAPPGRRTRPAASGSPGRRTTRRATTGRPAWRSSSPTSGLTPAVLQASYRHQRAVLAAAFDALDLPDEVVTRDRDTPPEAFGGFLALRSPWAGRLRDLLR